MKKYERVYLVDWLPPDFGATGQYIKGFANKDAESGLNTALIGLSSSNFSEDFEGFAGSGTLVTRRIKSGLPSKKSNLRRLSWALKANVSLVAHSFVMLARTKEVMITGSPPFLLFFIVPLKLI